VNVFLGSNKSKTGKHTIIYARVSSSKQSQDLKRQEKYLKTKYPTAELKSDIGSGLNYKRTGFRAILQSLFKGNIKEVVVAHKDRFTRFGFEFFEWLFNLRSKMWTNYCVVAVDNLLEGRTNRVSKHLASLALGL
jgi:predicted site-specific integrase-resolvase